MVTFILDEDFEMSYDEEPVSKRIQTAPNCAYCGRFVKNSRGRNWYNGVFDCYTWIYDCSKCGEGTEVECV